MKTNKKFLLSSELCPACHGLGVPTYSNEHYRIRVRFPKDNNGHSSWNFLDEAFASRVDGEVRVWQLFVGDSKVQYELIAPDGEIINVIPSASQWEPW